MVLQEKIDARRNFVNALQSVAHWATATVGDQLLDSPYISVLYKAVQECPAGETISIRSAYDDFTVVAVFTKEDVAAINHDRKKYSADWLEKLEITLNSDNVSFLGHDGKEFVLTSIVPGTINFTLTVDLRLDQATGYAEFVEHHTEFVG